MKQEYSIELVEEYENVNFYSIHLQNEELTELENFFVKFPEGCEYDEEIDVVISWLDKIAEKGALERYFRPEGSYGDGVGVIPIDVGNKIRLFYFDFFFLNFLLRLGLDLLLWYLFFILRLNLFLLFLIYLFRIFSLF